MVARISNRQLTTGYRLPPFSINIPPPRSAYTREGGNVGSVCAYTVRLRTDNRPPGTAAASRRSLACHLSEKRVACVFPLASATNLRQNTSTCIDGASLAKL
jgi:hypothetical protein